METISQAKNFNGNALALFSGFSNRVLVKSKRNEKLKYLIDKQRFITVN